MNQERIAIWMASFRLNTLPLSLSTICLGALLAIKYKAFDWPVFLLAIWTTLLLQILSNLANDYGDTASGVDNSERRGPIRSLQKGIISMEEMKAAIIICAILALLSGLLLIYLAFRGSDFLKAFILALFGLLSIGAALKYTLGKNPYGYSGFGDLMVFIFFGLVGVLGSFFLFTHSLGHNEWLPAVSIGLFSAGVLNLNNLRDYDNDRQHDKNTIVVKIGLNMAKRYHVLLIIMAWIVALIYSSLEPFRPWHYLYLFLLPLFLMHLKRVVKQKDPTKLNPELKYLSLCTFGFSLLFGISCLL